VDVIAAATIRVAGCSVPHPVRNTLRHIITARIRRLPFLITHHPFKDISLWCSRDSITWLFTIKEDGSRYLKVIHIIRVNARRNLTLHYIRNLPWKMFFPLQVERYQDSA
jgi:hypothetical protein